jgi:hypothetical protein
MNLNTTIVPKSDQLNADSLIAGPRTIKITAVESGTAEQPVTIRYEGDAGQPYKPSKSMRRVLVMLWGGEGAAYVGRRITIYRDAGVKFGGEAVGGIKISHASDIAQTATIMLTETRGKRKPHRVEPLAVEQASQPPTNLPAGWEDWSNEERGDNRAAAGIDALQAWWATLSAEEKKTLKTRLDADWKPTAARKGVTS